MDFETPTEAELTQLRKLHIAATRRRLYGRLFLLFNLLFLIYTYLYGVPSIYVIAVYALVLMYMIYLTLVAPLLTQCPRCKKRMTVLKGRCTGCGLDLSRARAFARTLDSGVRRNDDDARM